MTGKQERQTKNNKTNKVVKIAARLILIKQVKEIRLSNNRSLHHKAHASN